MPDRAELTRAFDESVRFTNRLLASSLIVLPLIAIVVETELYDRRHDIVNLEQAIAAEVQRSENDRRHIERRLLELRDVVLPDHLPSTDEIETKARAAVDAVDAESVAELTKLIRELDAIRKEEAGLEPKERNERRAFLTGLNTTLDILGTLRQELGPYRKGQTEIDEQKNDLKEYLNEERNAEEAIPTPFGTFNIHPRLGLLIVAFGSIVSYLAFATAAWRATRALARIAECDGRAYARPEVPFWLPLIPSRLPDEWRCRADERFQSIASVVLQVAWSIAGCALLVECTRWNMEDRIWYSSIPLVNGALWVGLYLQAFISSFWIDWAIRAIPVKPEAANVLKEIPGRLRERLSRRRFLIVSGGAALVVFGFRQLWLRLRAVSELRIRSDELVTNVASGVIHHRRLCAGHLPSQRHRARVTDTIQTGAIHQSMSASILEELAKDANDNEQATIYLKHAIEQSPASLRLYDRLVRIYGRQRRYQQIHKLLEDGLASAKQKELPRIVSGFEMRIAKAKERAAEASQ